MEADEEMGAVEVGAVEVRKARPRRCSGGGGRADGDVWRSDPASRLRCRCW